MKRTPRNYDGSGVTTHHLKALSGGMLTHVREAYQERPDLILAAWSEVIGSNLLSMTQAVSFNDGILLVKVKNSTLLSLLNQHDKVRILNGLRQKFPKVVIRNIVFRIG